MLYQRLKRRLSQIRIKKEARQVSEEVRILDPTIMSDDARAMQTFLLSRIIGQDRAVEQFVKVYQQISVGMNREDRPCGIFLFTGPTGVGKCFAKDTQILMYDGNVKVVQDIVVGDTVMGPDSKPRKVLSLSSGHDDLFQINPVKGEPHIVNSSHILSLKYTKQGQRRGKRKGNRSYKDESIINIPLLEYLQRSKTFKHITKLYKVPIEFKFQEVILDSYFLGLWLGDGSSSAPNITTTDVEIENYLESFAKSEKMWLSIDDITFHFVNHFHKVGGRQVENRILRKLRKLGVINNKHIPLEYKNNSKEVRLQLLAGLLDSDGSLSKGRNCYDFISVSEILARDVVYISRSLGFAAYVKPCKKTAQTGAEGTYYRVTISGDVSSIPVKIFRKKASERKQKKNVLVTGFSIKNIGKGDYYGFTLEGDGLFVLGDFTVTHNTELVRRAAEFVLGKKEAITRIDCGEFQASHEISKLIGSPPGYVGYNERSAVRLSQEKIDQYQTENQKINFLLFDEIEEAHEALLSSILQILDSGYLTLGNGAVTDFTKTIIILTSNLGEKEMQQELTGNVLGLAPVQESLERTDDRVYRVSKAAATRYFKAKFMNRIDRLIVFRSLSEESLRKILKNELYEVQDRLRAGPFNVWKRKAGTEPPPQFRPLLIFSDAAKSFLIKEGTSQKYGARELNRAIDRLVSFPLGALVGSKQIEGDDIIEIDYTEGEKHLIFKRTGKRDLAPIQVPEKKETLKPLLPPKPVPRRPFGYGGLGG